MEDVPVDEMILETVGTQKSNIIEEDTEVERNVDKMEVETPDTQKHGPPS